MCLSSVDGEDEMHALTLNLVRGLKQSFFSKTGTSSSYSSSISVLESMFNFMDS